MPTRDDSAVLVLQEFRLHAPDTDGAVARMVEASPRQSDGAVPLLTSIDDPRDVAMLREGSAGPPGLNGPSDDTALGRLVATWQPVKRYLPRIAERSGGAPSSFRLAVTESGINDEQVASPGKMGGEPTPGEHVALLLIGVPMGTHAGLLVLVGRDDQQPLVGGRHRTSWPLPLSRDLGVRVYESGPATSAGRREFVHA